MDTRLTICSVSFGHGRLLSLNAQLAARLNPDFERRVIWRVAENAPPNAKDRITAGDGPFVIEPRLEGDFPWCEPPACGCIEPISPKDRNTLFAGP